MFNDLNQCNFTGRLGADPETRTFSNGSKVCNLRLAVSESWKSKDTGERKEKTEWISAAVFGDGLVGLCERFLKKGSRVALRGKITTRKWQDQSGNDRYSTEVVLQGFDAFIQVLDGKAEGSQSSNNDSWGNGASDLDDEVPGWS